MKTTKIKRFSIITFIVTLLLTGGIFAYWASGVLGTDKDTITAITIGQGQEEITLINLEEKSKTQGKLVPAGYKVDDNQTEEILIKFEVEPKAETDGAVGAEAKLVVTILEKGHALIVAKVLEHEEKIVAGGSKVEVTISVKLTEPNNKEEYDEVANQNFTLNVQLEAVI